MNRVAISRILADFRRRGLDQLQLWRDHDKTKKDPAGLCGCRYKISGQAGLKYYDYIGNPKGGA